MLTLLQDSSLAPANGFNDLIGAAAALFVMLLVVATIAEQILELTRGTLERFGIKLLKGRISLEQAQKIAAEVLPASGVALAKANAMIAVSAQYKKTLAKKTTEIQEMRDEVAQALGPDLTGKVTVEINSKLAALTTEVRSLVDGSEAGRVYVLRLLSCAVCCGLCLVGGFNAFEIAAKEMNFAAAWLSDLPGQLLTGFAAASGSSYWHDALDKIRVTKNAIGQMGKVAAA